MPNTKQIDAAFEIVATECKWSINKLDIVRRMLEAAENASSQKCRSCGAALSRYCPSCAKAWES